MKELNKIDFAQVQKDKMYFLHTTDNEGTMSKAIKCNGQQAINELKEIYSYDEEDETLEEFLERAEDATYDGRDITIIYEI